MGLQDDGGFRAADNHSGTVVGDRADRARRHRLGDPAAPVPPGASAAFARPPQWRTRRLEPCHQLRAAAAADNFSARGVVDHDERYRVADEAIEVVKKLWDSWGEDTIVEDRVAGIFNDISRIHVPDHHGRYFDVKGPSAPPARRRGGR